MARLAGMTAVVTGGSRGIGRGIAEGFAAEGADVAVLDIQPAARGRAVVDAVEASGQRGLYIEMDVRDESSVTAAMAEAMRALGRIDILVNNAGILHESSFTDLSVDDWDRVMSVNLRGVFLCTRAVVPHMLGNGSGRIINIASQLGQVGGRNMTAYSASKAGVIGLTKSLARELSAHNVRVNAIAPGPIETDMMADESPEWKRDKLAELPLGRFGEVSEVVPTAIFLASDDSALYVGQALGPNSGDVML